MLALSVTVTAELTRYAVPVSVLCTVTNEVFLTVAVATETIGPVVSMVIVLVEAAERLSEASTAYTLYVPSTRPAALSEVLVQASEIVT